ncbi:class A beta-lactamase-related serine hydrolase [Sphingobacterium sp. SRCM116780]|uniref:serine hydrolase n=1 Tax=Sphingobacterium sp. SRCM116780 TaxID=2907623 RepID=UPI001F230D0C|nr:serine hydrolase [Sphingobacterium sp. SRCM116780]UIR56504.1 class A beta-lactamase-related serine hydrolase [Sphingobacterium sp. SRCM116780]
MILNTITKTLTLLFICIISHSYAQKMDTIYLEKLLQNHPDLFQNILNHPSKNEVQILYTQIDRDKNNTPHFRSYSYRLNPNWYFYPASTVKLPTAILALEKINELHIPGLTKDTPLRIDSAFEKQTTVTKDTSARNGLPSVAQYIKKILLTSDNDAQNRLFEFIGRAELNSKLKKYGTLNSRIVNRLAIGDKGIWAKHTNPITFYQDGKTIYQQPAQFDPNDYTIELKNTTQGKGYMNDKEEIIYEPWSFEGLNVFALEDQQLIMKKLLFPEVFESKQRFKLKKEDYAFIYDYMSRYPFESDYPKYDTAEFWPTYSKLLFYGRDKEATINPNIRVFNKYGDSYGYNIDNAYIVDFENGIEFLLAVVVQSNENGIYNDGIYEYETVTYPFLKNIGQVIYQEELKRVKKFKPDLSKFDFRK